LGNGFAAPMRGKSPTAEEGKGAQHSFLIPRPPNTISLVRLTALLAVLFLCATSFATQPQKTSVEDRLARTVTIYRDRYGVPHVFGATDASTAFGFAYAQAEDNFWRVEENYILALGRGAELYGEKSLDEDRRNRALEIPRLAREEYAMLSRLVLITTSGNIHSRRRVCSGKSSRGIRSPSFATTIFRTALLATGTCRVKRKRRESIVPSRTTSDRTDG
jgi:Penicillin amidase